MIRPCRWSASRSAAVTWSASWSLISVNRSMSLVARFTNPCAIMAPPPARARVDASGSANAVRAIRSCRGSSGMHSGCRARGVDERLPRRADPGWQVHLVPQPYQFGAVDEVAYVVQSAFDKHDLVQISPSGGIGQVPTYGARV